MRRAARRIEFIPRLRHPHPIRLSQLRVVEFLRWRRSLCLLLCLFSRITQVFTAMAALRYTLVSFLV